MQRLVYNGKRFAFVETADPPKPQEELPRRPATASRLPKKRTLRRLVPFRLDGVPNGYRPGHLLELGHDQCRYTLPDGLMCGARGFPWCPHHAAVVRE